METGNAGGYPVKTVGVGRGGGWDDPERGCLEDEVAEEDEGGCEDIKGRGRKGTLPAARSGYSCIICAILQVIEFTASLSNKKTKYIPLVLHPRGTLHFQ